MTETADPRVIEIDQFYPHPPQRVWRALTTPELMARWLMEPSGFAPVVGTRFSFQGQPMPSVGFSGEIACEVIDAVEGKQLAISWADARSDKPPASVVSWTLHPEGTGTQARHWGAPPAWAPAGLGSPASSARCSTVSVSDAASRPVPSG
jgi:uncharacterized protein YndB with AHSA1/START domain